MRRSQDATSACTADVLDGGDCRFALGRVTILIHHNNHTVVSGATVSGSWSNRATGNSSCTTNGNGQCAVTNTGIAKRVSSVTLTVGSVSSALSYSPAANHDPDADSSGTNIVVSKP